MKNSNKSKYLVDDNSQEIDIGIIETYDHGNNIFNNFNQIVILQRKIKKFLKRLKIPVVNILEKKKEELIEKEMEEVDENFDFIQKKSFSSKVR